MSKRILAEMGCLSASPLIFCCAGLHGNEYAGISAIERVCLKIKNQGLPLCGGFLAFQGHQRGLAEQHRYLDQDMNRLWTKERTDILESGQMLCTGLAEDKEQQEIFELIDPFLKQAQGEVYFIDLHTVSSEGPPFSVVTDLERSYEFFSEFPISSILRINGEIEGALIEYFNRRGAIAAVVEGGSHDNPSSVDRLEEALWVMLLQTGAISAKTAPHAQGSWNILKHEQSDLPPSLEVTYHHWIKAEDQFVMKPGYCNLQSIEQGEILANDKNGPVHAPHEGRIFLPLYQKLGEQGFMLVQTKTAKQIPRLLASTGLSKPG